jgi:hypothetical protein
MTSSKGRRLLAVMFTDVVGYTALIQRDKEADRIVRRRHRQALDAAVPAIRAPFIQAYSHPPHTAVQPIRLKTSKRVLTHPKV